MEVCVYAPIRVQEAEGCCMSARPNSLQAVLERQAAAAAPPQAPAPPSASTAGPPEPAKPEKFYRPSRDGRRFLGGHFPPHVVRQMKMLAAEEDTTTQALLEEALDLLFVKKGKGKIMNT